MSLNGHVMEDTCTYHPKRLFKRYNQTQGYHECCQQSAGSPGCKQYPFHVSSEIQNRNYGLERTGSKEWNKYTAIIAMDCELALTTFGLELAKVTLINWWGGRNYYSTGTSGPQDKLWIAVHSSKVLLKKTFAVLQQSCIKPEKK